MADVRVAWFGFKELRAALQALPAELAEEAAGIVSDAADDAVHDIVGSYPYRTGNLRKGVKRKDIKVGPYGPGVKVMNTSPLADIYEKGSQVRHYYTVKGKKHLTGRMPARPTFVPAVVKARRAMNRQLIALLQRSGAVVTGDAG